MKKLDRAIELACEIHRGQPRDEDPPMPYVTHPMEVLLNLRFVGNVDDEEMLCAAMLHDAVECGGDLDQIGLEMGSRVQSLVSELTRNEPTHEEIASFTKREIWRVRADMLIAEVAKMSPEAQQIKLADRLSNLQDAYRHKKGEKLTRYQWQTREILKVVPRSTNKGLWDAIDKLL